MTNQHWKFVALSLSSLSILLLAGCGGASKSENSEGHSGTANSTSGTSLNSLTGLPGKNGPVLFVKVDDTPPAHPQVGLELADVVYIEEVEGGLTRIAAVFSSQLPTKVGPIRSARISDIDLMAQYGHVGFAFSGAQTKFLPVLDAANIEDIGADHEPPSLYSRDSSRPDPTNMLLDPTALLNKSINIEHRNIATAQSVGWEFGLLPAGGTPITSMKMKWPTSSYQATWSPSQERWLLSYNGATDMDSDGIQLGSPNFVIQEVSITNSIYHDHLGNYTPFSNTVGSGSGWLLRDGQEIPILWNRATAASPTTWTLPNGATAYFNPGQVWVALTDQQPDFTFPATAQTAPANSK